MEGVTEPCFRDLVLALNDPAALGGAFTEFVRVLDRPLAQKRLAKHLGTARFAQPVGLQLMGADLAALAASARAAEAAGAALVDLNFGCPAKGALRGCAGSAMLQDPAALERAVRACAEAVRHVPVTAKIRAGFADASRVEELAQAAAAGGARMLTVHCRTKAEGYQPEVDWTRIARAVLAVSIPVCGNGGVQRHADLERMRAETGCRYVMVGQAALGDPWIFTGSRVTAQRAARFLADYARRLCAAGFTADGAAARVKQLLRRWSAGALVDRDRAAWLAEKDGARLLERLERLAELAPEQRQRAPRSALGVG